MTESQASHCIVRSQWLFPQRDQKTPHLFGYLFDLLFSPSITSRLTPGEIFSARKKTVNRTFIPISSIIGSGRFCLVQNAGKPAAPLLDQTRFPKHTGNDTIANVSHPRTARSPTAPKRRLNIRHIIDEEPLLPEPILPPDITA